MTAIADVTPAPGWGWTIALALIALVACATYAYFKGVGEEIDSDIAVRREQARGPR